MTAIHSTAIVSAEAELDSSVSVGPYAVIGPGVQIGAGTTIGSHALLKGPTVIGRDNRIFGLAVIGEDPQDKKYGGEPTRLEIGDRNTFREFCSVHRGTAQDKGVTRVGNDNWIMAYVHIAHDCVVANDVICSNNTTLAGHVHVGDHVICSGFSAIHQFCRLGAHSFLGGFAAITRDVPPYVMVAGTADRPAWHQHGRTQASGFRVRDQLRNLKDAYRILYRDGLQLAEARDRLALLAETQPELRILVDFIDSSERSLIR